MTPNDAFEFFVELVSQLFHADVLITEQVERIEPSRPRSSGCDKHLTTSPGRPMHPNETGGLAGVPA